MAAMLKVKICFKKGSIHHGLWNIINHGLKNDFRHAPNLAVLQPYFYAA